MHTDILFGIVPHVVVGDHRQHCVAKPCLSSQSSFRHCGHADDGGAPGAVEARFRSRRELRSLDTDVCAVTTRRTASKLGRFADGGSQSSTERLGQTYVCHDAHVEKRAFTVDGSIDDLIWCDKRSRWKVFAQASDRAETQEMGYAELLECKNVRAIRNRGRRVHMTNPVPGQKENVRLADAGLTHWAAGTAKWRIEFDDLMTLALFELVDAAAADHS